MKIIKYTTIFVMPIFIYWVMLYVLGFNRLTLLSIFPVLLLSFILFKFLYDNFRVYGFSKIISIFPVSVVLYLPIAMSIIPALYVTRKFEAIVFEQSNELHERCQDKIRIIQEEHEVGDDFKIWNPWTWGGKVKVIVKKEITEKTSIFARVIYGHVVSLLDVLIMINRFLEVIIISFSFGFIFSQTLVGRTRVEVEI